MVAILLYVQYMCTLGKCNIAKLVEIPKKLVGPSDFLMKILNT